MKLRHFLSYTEDMHDMGSIIEHILAFSLLDGVEYCMSDTYDSITVALKNNITYHIDVIKLVRSTLISQNNKSPRTLALLETLDSIVINNYIDRYIIRDLILNSNRNPIRLTYKLNLMSYDGKPQQ